MIHILGITNIPDKFAVLIVIDPSQFMTYEVFQSYQRSHICTQFPAPRFIKARRVKAQKENVACLTSPRLR